MADQVVEHEICGNCKREIPQSNYVMHTAHCARNITLCQVCKEPVMKADYPDHAKKCVKKAKSPPKQKTPEPPMTNLEKSSYYQSRKEVQDKKLADRREKYLERHEKFSTDSTSRKLGSNLQSLSSSSGSFSAKEPVVKADYLDHAKKCVKKAKSPPKQKTPEPPMTNLEKSSYYQSRKEVQDKKLADRREKYLERHEKFSTDSTSRKLGSNLQSLSSSSGSFSAKEPVVKADYLDHAKKCVKKAKSPPKQKTPEPPMTNLEKSSYYQSRKEVQDKKLADRREKYLERHEKFSTDSTSRKLGSNLQSPSSSSGSFSAKNTSFESTSVRSTNMVDSAVSTATSKITSNSNGAIKKKEEKEVNGTGAVPKPSSGLMPCRYCELELPKVELEDHENYCGSRTDKCLECGELVMFKHKQVHLDTNHGFLKLNDEPGPKPSWESTTQKSHSPPRTRRVFNPAIYTDFSQFDPTDYLPSNYRIPKPKIEKGESYKEISRRLDCKTEYIRNLLHDSASITVPLRHSGAVPRNHFNHNKGPAPQPPGRRRNPPTELCIPCEFCDTPIPHMDLVQHETGCRPDLFTSRARARSFEFDDYEARAASPIEEPKKPMQSDLLKPSRRKMQPKVDLLIPCEFCDDPIPEDDLIQHQTGCRPDLARFGMPAQASAFTPEVELPCEFCSDMFPASQLYRHEATCG